MKQSKDFPDREKEWEKGKSERSRENENFLQHGKRQEAFIEQVMKTLQKSGLNLKSFFANSAKELKKTDKEMKAWETAFIKRIKSQKKLK